MAGDRDFSSGNAPAPPGRTTVPRIDPTVPHPARMYNYYLGGKDHFSADRKAAETVLAFDPQVRQSVRDNRAFLQRAVRFLGEAGISQFLDIGAGLPSPRNVHEIAQEIDPAARVVYVDNDPVVMSHARALLASTSPEGKVAHVQADLRDPEAILGHPEVRATLDFDRPVGLLPAAVLMYIADHEEPHRLVRRLVDALPPGSHLVLSHASRDLIPPQAVRSVSQFFARSGMPFALRSHAEILRFFDGTELIEPGLVKAFRWRPEKPDPRGPDGATGVYGGVGRKPGNPVPR